MSKAEQAQYDRLSRKLQAILTKGSPRTVHVISTYVDFVYEVVRAGPYPRRSTPPLSPKRVRAVSR